MVTKKVDATTAAATVDSSAPLQLLSASQHRDAVLAVTSKATTTTAATSTTKATATSSSTTRRFWTSILVLLCMAMFVANTLLGESKSIVITSSEETGYGLKKTPVTSSSSSSSSSSTTRETRAGLGHNDPVQFLPDIDPSLLQTIQTRAKAFVEERKAVYIEQNAWQTFTWRGIGYVWLQHEMILAAVLPQSPIQTGRNKVTIFNALQQQTTDGARTTQTRVHECWRWTLWVRVAGPELFAGNATAVVDHANDDNNNNCHWEFYFDLQVPGIYVVDAKLLHYNAMFHRPFDACESRTNHVKTVEEMEKVTLGDGNNETGDATATATASTNIVPLVQRYPVHGGFIGFKMYSPALSCCEICARLSPHCIYWSTPPLQFIHQASHVRTGCELYFHNETAQTHPDMVPKSHLLADPQFLARRRRRNLLRGALLQQQQGDDASFSTLQSNTSSIEQVYSTMPIRIRFLNDPNIIADTDPTNNNNTIAVKRKKRNRRRRMGSAQYAHGAPHKSVPATYHIGCGWNYWWTLDFPCLSGEFDDQIYLHEKEFSLLPPPETVPAVQRQDLETTKTTTTPLPLCTLEDETFEKHHGRWVRRPWPTEEQCPAPMIVDKSPHSRFQIVKVDPDHPLCWHRDDLSVIGWACIEMNCRLIQPTSKWVSHLHNEKEWYGYWKNYHCDYMDFTNAQLAQCFAEKKVGSIGIDGRSIASYLGEYVTQRLQGVTMYSGDDAVKVVLSTLSMLHIKGPGFAEKISKERHTLNATKEQVFFVSGFYLSSERDTDCTAYQMEHDSKVAYDILQPRGYNMIQLFDLSAAFTFDTATQFDGMHIIGPPMKMALVKLFHHMCSDLVEGTRLA